MAAATEVAWDDQAPRPAPAAVLLKQGDIAIAISCVELTFTCCRVIEKQIRVAAATEVAWDDQAPGPAPAGVLLKHGDIAITIGRVEFTFPC